MVTSLIENCNRSWSMENEHHDKCQHQDIVGKYLNFSLCHGCGGLQECVDLGDFQTCSHKTLLQP